MVEDAESTQIPSARAAAAAALQWYAHMGADEAIGDVRVDGFARSAELAARRTSAPARDAAVHDGGSRAPLNRPAAPANQTPRPVPRQPAAAPSMAMDEVEQLAQSCNSLDELARTLNLSVSTNKGHVTSLM